MDVPVSGEAGEAADPPVACSLGAHDVPERLAEWSELLAFVTERLPIEGGVRLALASDAPVARIAELAVAEQRCCAFFRFAVTVDTRGPALEVTAPIDGQVALAELFG